MKAAITDGKGVNVVFDSIGKATFEASIDSLAPRGYFMSFGATTGEAGPVAASTLQHLYESLGLVEDVASTPVAEHLSHCPKPRPPAGLPGGSVVRRALVRRRAGELYLTPEIGARVDQNCLITNLYDRLWISSKSPRF